MKITVWHGCRVEYEIDLAHAPGPNISLDPWADLIGLENQAGMNYRNGFLLGAVPPSTWTHLEEPQYERVEPRKPWRIVTKWRLLMEQRGWI